MLTKQRVVRAVVSAVAASTVLLASVAPAQTRPMGPPGADAQGSLLQASDALHIDGRESVSLCVH